MMNYKYCKIYNNEDYFLNKSCEGFEEYKQGTISHLKKIQINLLNIKDSDSFLDVGCGRGEVAAHVLNITPRVAAIDYSEVSVKLTDEICKGRANVKKALASELPFENNSFSKILLGDVIEHLTIKDSYKCLFEIKRVLKDGGALLIHTCPNTNFIRYVLPLAYFFLKVIKPESIEDIKEQVKHRDIDHINEYSPERLLKQCKQIGFTCYYEWPLGIARDFKHNLTSDFPQNSLFKMLDKISLLPMLRNIIVNDLFLICRK